MRSSFCGSRASSSSRSPPSSRRWPGACISSMRICSTWCRRCSPRCESAFAKQFPGEPLEVPLFFQFGSWIGGRSGRQSLRHQRGHAAHARGRRASRASSATGPGCSIWCAISSIEDHALAAAGLVPHGGAQSAIRRLPDGEARAARNRGEIFRQFIGCMLARIEITIEHAEREAPGPARARAIRNADALIEDIDLMRERA